MGWDSVLTLLSPQLRRETKRELNQHWVLRISFLKGFSDPFVTDVSDGLTRFIFLDQENFGQPGYLYIALAGAGYRNMRHKSNGKVILIASGDVWGEDHLLLSAKWLLTDNSGVAVSHVECQALSKKHMDIVLPHHPQVQRTLRKIVVNLLFRRAVFSIAELHKQFMTSKHSGDFFDLKAGEQLDESKYRVHRLYATVRNLTFCASSKKVAWFEDGVLPDKDAPTGIELIASRLDGLVTDLHELTARTIYMEKYMLLPGAKTDVV